MVLNLSSLQSTLSMIDGERGVKIPNQVCLNEEPRLKKIHQKFVITLGAYAYSRSQIKIWVQKFRNGDLSWNDAPHTGRSSLTLGRNLRHFFKSIFV
jgi:hypothetical protein